MAKGKYKEWLKPEKLVLLQGWARNGLTDEQIAQNVGVRRETIYDWKKKYPNISNALKIGREQANFIIEGKLFSKASHGNVTAMIFWLKNNWRDKYNDSQLSKEERELRKQQARKAKAEADIARYKADLLANPDSVKDKTLIIDDIPEGADDNAD